MPISADPGGRRLEEVAQAATSDGDGVEAGLGPAAQAYAQGRQRCGRSRNDAEGR